MQKKKQGDRWSLLADELGLDVPTTEDDLETTETAEAPAELKETSRQEAAEPVTARASSDGFGAGLLDEDESARSDASPRASSNTPSETSFEVEEGKKSREGKKTFFGRFPKINLFGSSGKEGLAPPLAEGTGSFTSKKLEKVPIAPSRSERADRARPESPSEVKATAEPMAAEQVAASPDPWSQIATQVGTLSNPETRADRDSASDQGGRGRSKNKDKNPAPRGRGERKPERDDQGRGRATPPSMFDDDRSESEESVALRNLIEDDADSGDVAAKRLDRIFSEDAPQRDAPGDRSESRSERERSRPSRRRGGRDPKPGREQGGENQQVKEQPGRSSMPERDERDDKPKREERTRGRRGSRYTPREESYPVAETEPERQQKPERVDDDRFEENDYGQSTWDIEEESQPVERSSRGRRRGRRSERAEDRSEESRPSVPSRSAPERNDDGDDDSDSERFDFSQLHKNIPSWDDAIGVIIESNNARHQQRGSDSRRGRR